MVADFQTLNDLEFNTIRDWLAEYTIGNTAKNKALDLEPSSEIKAIEKSISITSELLNIREEESGFPNLEYEELIEEIRILRIERASLEQDAFLRILRASELCNRLLYFFDKREQDYPLCYELVNKVYFTKEIIELINKVFDGNGKIKDDASNELMEIRSSKKSVERDVNKNFDREVRRLLKLNVLGDTKESFINQRRVLTVLASHKRKVNGVVVGSSNTGNLVYIEPQINIPLNNELEVLFQEERSEIFAILQHLRQELSAHLPLIKDYQEVLTELDFVQAKMKLARTLECTKPSINSESELELIDAYHPILWKSNKALNKITYPQQIQMDKFSRMLVISGPNAGGKSITLKSIGLLQLMVQSGLLLPAHKNSRVCVFDHICSDIGDNQSIENELSTYSYRLKRMRGFHDIANKKTLLLLDEFGTGSDPDLGGALAEALFESLYTKKCFGVITTHYNNIKLKADKLKNAVNGCMLFNTDTLEPTYQFSVGQPGSSFTFEVARMNGIPEKIIEEAKTKLDEKRVEMDVLLSQLQKEKSYFEKMKAEYIEAQIKLNDALEKTTISREEYETKWKAMMDSSEVNNRLIRLGNKMDGFLKRYETRSRKKNINQGLVEDIRKYLAVEKTKMIDAVEKKKKVIQEKSKKSPSKKKTVKKDNYHREKIVIGSKVKVISTKQIGTVEEIDDEKITVTFGFVRMKVDKAKLMWIS